MYPSNSLYIDSKEMYIRQLFTYNLLIYNFKNKNLINFKDDTYNTRHKNITLKNNIDETVTNKHFFKYKNMFMTNYQNQ